MTCPLCGARAVYLGLNSVECAGEACANRGREATPEVGMGSFAWARARYLEGYWLEFWINEEWVLGVPNCDIGERWRVSSRGKSPPRLNPWLTP